MKVKLKLVRTWEPDISNSFTSTGKRSLLKRKWKEEYFVLSEAYPIDTGHENMLFEGDKDGKIVSYSDLWSERNISHSEALKIVTNSNGIVLYDW